MSKVSKILSDKEKEKLKAWLDELKISPKKLHRHFSDGVQMAKLLKEFYPRLIELHCYIPCNSTHSKMVNWEMLNTKVLFRLGLEQKHEILEKYAQSVPGEIDILLNELRELLLLQRSFYCRLEDNYEDYDFDDILNEDDIKWEQNNIMTFEIMKKKDPDGKRELVEQKFIGHDIYEVEMRNLGAVDSALRGLQRIIENLENSIKQKNDEVDVMRKKIKQRELRAKVRKRLSNKRKSFIPFKAAFKAV